VTNTNARATGDWKTAGRTPAGDVLTDLVMRTFRLNGRFLEVAEGLSRPVGLTAAWWQVLGATLGEPLPVSGIARDMGLARQSVQRIADLLVERELAAYRPNPAHRRAKLLEPTARGRQAIADLAAAQHDWADRIAATVDLEALRVTLDTVESLAATLATDAG
jgi:DNA-binding MarR family transcriptional regulator